jgi:hypothetical protein
MGLFWDSPSRILAAGIRAFLLRVNLVAAVAVAADSAKIVIANCSLSLKYNPNGKNILFQGSLPKTFNKLTAVKLRVMAANLQV